LMRAWPPWLSRLSVSVFSSVAAKLLIGPFLLAGRVGELGQRPGCGRRLELPEQVRELAVGRLMRSARHSAPAAGLDRRLGVGAARAQRRRARVGDRPVAREDRWWRQASSPVSSATARTSVCETRTSTRGRPRPGSSE
jgi:hypothetical protein